MHLFETERLIIRPLSHQDLPSLAELLSDPDVMKHSVNGVCDEAATIEFIERCLACYVSHGIGPLALVEKNNLDLVGFCGVGPEMVCEVEENNLGYRLAKRYWNSGLASEAAKAVLEYAFTEKLFGSVVVIIEPENVASIKVAEKIGFSDFHELIFHGSPVRLYRLNHGEWSSMHNPAMQGTGTL